MSVDYFRCEFCGIQLMQPQAGRTQFPITRRYRDPIREEGLIAVRCAECSDLPYRLEIGQPYRIDLIGEDHTNIIHDINSDYNYFPRGIGHLLEVYVRHPSAEYLSIVRNGAIEIGFMVYEDANLIVVAYKLSDNGWNITPYCWLAQKEWLRGLPPENLVSEEDRKFTIALVDTEGGKYRLIREGLMSPDFAAAFHKAIRSHIEKGAPDSQTYRWRIDNMASLLMEDDLRSKLVAVSTI